jgi:hypothetical protein
MLTGDEQAASLDKVKYQCQLAVDAFQMASN